MLKTRMLSAELTLTNPEILLCLSWSILMYSIVLGLHCRFSNRVKSLQPCSSFMIWHVFSNWCLSCGALVQQLTITNSGMPEVQMWSSWYQEFWFFASSGWFLIVFIDLLLALVNPWMNSRSKVQWYHMGVWFSSLFLTNLPKIPKSSGLGGLNHRHLSIAVATCSWSVLIFAAFRLLRRQQDLTYRSKRRNLLQHARYLSWFSLFWFLDWIVGTKNMTTGLLMGYATGVVCIWTLHSPVSQIRPPSLIRLPTTSGHVNVNENPVEKEEEIVDCDISHFSAALRQDLRTYIRAGIYQSITRPSPSSSSSSGGPTSTHLDHDKRGEGHVSNVLNVMSSQPRDSASRQSRRRMMKFTRKVKKKRRFVTDILTGDSPPGPGSPPFPNQESKTERRTSVDSQNLPSHLSHQQYEKLGLTEYRPLIFQHIRERLLGLSPEEYRSSFEPELGLVEQKSEGKSGQLFYFSGDRKYVVKTMSKSEHSFLLEILPRYHAYLRVHPCSFLCRFVGCYSMQLPIGWNKMFFIVMENIFGPDSTCIAQRYDLKGTMRNIIQKNPPAGAQAFVNMNERTTTPNETSSLLGDFEFLSHPSEKLVVEAETRVSILSQMTDDCHFLKDLNILDYSCLIGRVDCPNDVTSIHFSKHLVGHNPHCIISMDHQHIYYLAFVDILQHYDCRWKIQRSILSCVQDQAQLTALPPADYALRFLRFVHTHLFTSAKIHPPGIHRKNPPASTRVASYGTSSSSSSSGKSNMLCPPTKQEIETPPAQVVGLTTVSSRRAVAQTTNHCERDVMTGIAATVTNVSFYDHHRQQPSPESRHTEQLYRPDSPASVNSAPDTMV